MRFYLGSHEPAWLGRTDVPLCVSDTRLRRRVKLPRALGLWGLDCGAFGELSRWGRFATPAAEYARRAERYRVEVGGLAWAAPQDWMCEPGTLAMTGRTVAEHQVRTVASLLELRALAPAVPWIPVLQGWSVGEYLDHVERYAAAGLELAGEPLVGVGSLCRRQATAAAVAVLQAVRSAGLARLHCFGLKMAGLAAAGELVGSADSMAWSYGGRRRRDWNGHRCGNCLGCALAWRRSLLWAVWVAGL